MPPAAPPTAPPATPRPGPRLDWPVATLTRALAPLGGQAMVEVLAETGSTNSTLLERARAGSLQAPALLVAERQTAGRGRQGKAWQSALGDADLGASLTFSLALPYAPASWSGLSLAVGLALADALDPARPGQPPRLGLKWPNDVLRIDPGSPTLGRKLCGILIETVQAGAQRVVVVGIGINIRPLAAAPGPDAPAPAWGLAHVAELLPGATAPGVLATVLPGLAQVLQRFEAEGFAPCVAGYARRDLLAGRRVATTLAAWPTGQAQGVDAQGRLLLREGRREGALDSGEVSLRLAPD